MMKRVTFLKGRGLGTWHKLDRRVIAVCPKCGGSIALLQAVDSNGNTVLGCTSDKCVWMEKSKLEGWRID